MVESRRYTLQRVYSSVSVSEPVTAPNLDSLEATILWTAEELSRYLNSYSTSGSPVTWQVRTLDAGDE